MHRDGKHQAVAGSFGHCRPPASILTSQCMLYKPLKSLVLLLLLLVVTALKLELQRELHSWSCNIITD